jgi:hypothetical protein
MRYVAGDSLVSLFCLLFLLGCVPYAPQSPNRNLPQDSTERNLRNEILTQIEGKDADEKLAILLKIISATNDRPLRRDAIRYLSGTLVEASILSNPLTDLLLMETDSAIVNDLEDLLSNREFDLDHYLLDASLTASESQHLRIVKVMGLRKTSTPEAFNYFRQHLTAGSLSLFVKTCEAMVEIGPPARVLLPELVAAADQPRFEMTPSNSKAARDSRDKTHAAGRAINAVGPDVSAVEKLRKLLAMEASIATQAAEALAQLESEATAAIPELKQLLKRDDHGGRDVKTKIARDSAKKALDRIARSVAP